MIRRFGTIFNFLFLILVYTVSCRSPSKEPTLKVENGTLVVPSFYDLGKAFDLHGSYRFVWNDFVDPLGKDKFLSYDLIPVPGPWNRIGKPGRGIGSYILDVQLPRAEMEIGFRIGDVQNAYTMFINGEVFIQMGKVGKTSAEYRPQRVPVYKVYQSKSRNLHIVIWCSNFYHARGGITGFVTLGTPNAIKEIQIQNTRFEFFTIGVYLFIAIYHIGFFILRRKDFSALILGLICIVYVVRLIVTEEKLISQIFPDLRSDFLAHIDWAMPMLLVPLFSHFVNLLFPRQFNRYFLYIVWGLFGLATGFALLGPLSIVTLLIDFLGPVVVLCLLYAVYVAAAAIRKHEIGAKTFMFFFSLSALTILNDVIGATGAISTRFIAAYGFMLFIFAQAFILSKRFANAFATSEALGESLTASNAELTELKENLEKKVAERTQELTIEHKKNETLLLNILPVKIVEELKENGIAKPVLFSSASVMFTDFVGFTKIAESMSPEQLVLELDRCFSYFDQIMQKYNLEKIKTIGDSYMCAGGLPTSNETHAIDCALAAMEIQAFMNQMKEIKEKSGFDYWELRLGIHTGPVIGGIVGEKKFAYDVWGDTVNTASRLESSGTPGRINISNETVNHLKSLFNYEYRGKVSAKNKGEIDMYYLQGIKPEFSVGQEGRVPNTLFFSVYERMKAPE